MTYCNQDPGIEPKMIPKTSQKSILEFKRYLLIAVQCIEETSLRSLRVQNFSLLERLVQRSVGWRAVFSTIYEVVISPRQAQVSFHSVSYANVVLFCVEDDAEYVYLWAWTFTTIGGLRSRSAEKNYLNPAAAVLAQRILSQKTSKGTQTDAKRNRNLFSREGGNEKGSEEARRKDNKGE